VGREDAEYVNEECLPYPKLKLMQQVHRKQCIHVEAGDIGHECILETHVVSIRLRVMGSIPTTVGIRDQPPISFSIRDPETL
jgi:hypothetical protein